MYNYTYSEYLLSLQSDDFMIQAATVTSDSTSLPPRPVSKCYNEHWFLSLSAVGWLLLLLLFCIY